MGKVILELATRDEEAGAGLGRAPRRARVIDIPNLPQSKHPRRR
ncbi:hypothetical protein YT1_1188 [Rhodococcus ruber]|nr:hypothetical protein YT1_1188 [Rhodococcus ruber]